MLSVSNLTRMVLPNMAQKNKGAIVHVSSLNCSSLLPGPYSSICSASNCFVEKLFDSLRYEYKNVAFQCLYHDVNHRNHKQEKSQNESKTNYVKTLGWVKNSTYAWSSTIRVCLKKII